MLIHPITVQQISGYTQSGTGNKLPVWTDVLETWCQIKPLRGRNIELGMIRTKGKAITHQIAMRYSDLPLEVVTCRIVYDGRIFEIYDILNVLEQNSELDILANEVTS